MKPAGALVLAALLVAISGLVWSHESPCDHTHVPFEVCGDEYQGSNCLNPGEDCEYAPCGQVGRCGHVSYMNSETNDCVCLQVSDGGADYVNAIGRIACTYTDTILVPYQLTRLAIDFGAPPCPNQELVFLHNDESVLDHVVGAMSGGMEIWSYGPGSGSSEPWIHIMEVFWLTFPSYDYFGNPTGTNTWRASDSAVDYDYTVNELYSVNRIPMTIENGLGTFPGRLTWRFTYGDGRTLFRIAAAQEAPPTPVEQSHWGTIKALYR